MANFQRRGSYLRGMVQVLCHFFYCTTCKTHITMLPSSCVPYKQYPADEIEYCLDAAVTGRRPAEIEVDERNQGVSRSTIKRWLDEWTVNASLLASVASEKLSRVVQGGFMAIWRTLSQRYPGGSFFRNFQPDFCRKPPPIGIFRPLIRLS